MSKAQGDSMALNHYGCSWRKWQKHLYFWKRCFNI